MIPPLAAHKGKVVDDRGEAHDLVAFAELDGDPRQADPRFRLVVERCRSELSARRVWWPAMVGAGIASVFMICGIIWSLPPWSSYVIVFPVLVFSGLVSAQSVARRGVAPAAQTLIAAGLCPHCVYSLHGFPADSDGCKVCAECGAAWLNSRVLDDTPYESTARIGGVAHTKRGLDRFFGPGRSPTLEDESGVVRAVVGPSLKSEIAATTDPAMRARLVEAVRLNIAKGRAARWLSILALTVTPAFTVILFNLGGTQPRLSFGSVFIVAFCLYCIIRVLRNGTGISPKAIRHEMLKRDLCPSCATDLRNAVPAEVTGFISCPRCTATWAPQRRYHPVPPE